MSDRRLDANGKFSRLLHGLSQEEPTAMTEATALTTQAKISKRGPLYLRLSDGAWWQSLLRKVRRGS